MPDNKQVESVETGTPRPVNHDWVRNLIAACTSGNSHGNDVSQQVLCHRMAFQINKYFGLELRQWNTDLDPERDSGFKDPYQQVAESRAAVPPPSEIIPPVDKQHKAAQEIARQHEFDPLDANFARCVGAIMQAWRPGVMWSAAPVSPQQPDCDCGAGNDAYLARHSDACALNQFAKGRRAPVSPLMSPEEFSKENAQLLPDFTYNGLHRIFALMAAYARYFHEWHEAKR